MPDDSLLRRSSTTILADLGTLLTGLRDQIRTADQITRDLAASNPYTQDDATGLPDRCHHCATFHGEPHDNDCLWVRAVAYCQDHPA